VYGAVLSIVGEVRNRDGIVANCLRTGAQVEGSVKVKLSLCMT